MHASAGVGGVDWLGVDCEGFFFSFSLLLLVFLFCVTLSLAWDSLTPCECWLPFLLRDLFYHFLDRSLFLRSIGGFDEVDVNFVSVFFHLSSPTLGQTCVCAKVNSY